MTKRVRIENADTSNYTVRVRVFEEMLRVPADMTTQNVYLTSTRYVVVDELPAT